MGASEGAAVERCPLGPGSSVLPPFTGGPHYYGIPVARVTSDAFTETIAVLRCADHRRSHGTVCCAGSGADSVSGLSRAPSRPSRAGCPWPADLPKQLQLLPWLGRQGRGSRPEPPPGRGGAPRSARRADYAPPAEPHPPPGKAKVPA